MIKSAGCLTVSGGRRDDGFYAIGLSNILVRLVFGGSLVFDDDLLPGTRRNGKR
jgi:hypothetical protein